MNNSQVGLDQLIKGKELQNLHQPTDDLWLRVDTIYRNAHLDYSCFLSSLVDGCLFSCQAWLVVASFATYFCFLAGDDVTLSPTTSAGGKISSLFINYQGRPGEWVRSELWDVRTRVYFLTVRD